VGCNAIISIPIYFAFEIINMPRKVPDSKIDHAIKMILSGSTLKDAGIVVNVNPDCLSKHIRSRGISIPAPSTRKQEQIKLPNAIIISEYESGFSELELSSKYGVSRNVIRKRLSDAGIYIRNQSEANIISASRTGFDKRQDRCKAANAAVRGKKRPIISRQKRAITVESGNGKVSVGKGEYAFKDLIIERGIDFIWQKAADIYSIDFAIGNVAVELKGTPSFFGNPEYGLRRIEKLSEIGYRCVFILLDSDADIIANIDNIIGGVDFVSRHPSPLGKYWVIRSRIDSFTRTRNEKGQFSCIESAPQPFYSIREFYL
jgi:hypothetical protein